MGELVYFDNALVAVDSQTPHAGPRVGGTVIELHGRARPTHTYIMCMCVYVHIHIHDMYMHMCMCMCMHMCMRDLAAHFLSPRPSHT